MIESFHWFLDMVITAQTDFLTNLHQKESTEDDESEEHDEGMLVLTFSVNFYWRFFARIFLSYCRICC